MTFNHAMRALALVGLSARRLVGRFRRICLGPGLHLVDGGATLSFTPTSLQTLGIAGVTVTGIAPATFDGSKITMTSDDSLVEWNANFDLPSGTIFVDAKTCDYSSAFGSYKGGTFAGIALFKGSMSNAAFNIEATQGQISGSMLDLKLTSGAIPVLGDALGVPKMIQAALFPTLNFGRVDVSSNFVAFVPEPSTYALFAVGALVLAGAARRKARAQH